MQTTNRVLMSGNTAEAERVMVRKWAEHAAANGGSFEVRQAWTDQEWYTTVTINWPRAAEQPPCVGCKNFKDRSCHAIDQWKDFSCRVPAAGEA